MKRPLWHWLALAWIFRDRPHLFTFMTDKLSYKDFQAAYATWREDENKDFDRAALSAAWASHKEGVAVPDCFNTGRSDRVEVSADISRRHAEPMAARMAQKLPFEVGSFEYVGLEQDDDGKDWHVWECREVQ